MVNRDRRLPWRARRVRSDRAAHSMRHHAITRLSFVTEGQASQSLEIRPLQFEDASTFATLQRRVFPYYNSSKLGQRFCTALYRAYALRADAFGFGAWQGRTLVGLIIACHRDVEAAIQRTLRARAIAATLVRPHLLLRGAILRRALRLFGRRRVAPATPRPGEAPIDATCLRFVTMGVAPEARRQGLAARLTQTMYAEALRHGFRYAESNVYVTNHPQRRLREKMGWVPGTEPPDGRGSVRYSIDLRRAVSGGTAARGDQGTTA